MRNLSSQAAQILENEAWQQAYTGLNESLYAQWTNSQDWRKREQIFERYQALQDVRNKLETLLATGALD